LKNYNCRISSNDPIPWGHCWQVKISIIKGKNRERTLKYPLSVDIKLIAQTENPTHSMEWIYDTGKIVYNNQPCDRFVVMPGLNRKGWLIMLVYPLEGLISGGVNRGE
jgi:hypothetical protein